MADHPVTLTPDEAQQFASLYRDAAELARQTGRPVAADAYEAAALVIDGRRTTPERGANCGELFDDGAYGAQRCTRVPGHEGRHRVRRIASRMEDRGLH